MCLNISNKHKFTKYKTEQSEIENSNLSYDYKNKNDVIKYINCIANVEPSCNPCLIITYGPYGSGKTYNKEAIASLYNINNNFMFVSVDKFVNETKQFIKLKSTMLNTVLSSDEISLIKKEYFKIKKSVSRLLHILIGIALMYKYNIVLETSGANFAWYMTHYVNEFFYYKYKIYLHYFYTDNVTVLYNRVVGRDSIEHVFIDSCFIDKTLKQGLYNFNKIILSKQNINKFNAIYVYDATDINIIERKMLLFKFIKNKLIINLIN